MIYRCGAYLDNPEEFLGPKNLSERTIYSILRSGTQLVASADPETITSFLHFLESPVDDNDPSHYPQWCSKTFFPSIVSSPTKQYLESDSFLAPFGLTLSKLLSLMFNEDHTICSASLKFCLVLLLTVRKEVVIPFLPGFLSNLALLVKKNSRMTWKERVLATIVFTEGLLCLPMEQKTTESSVDSTIASWMAILQGKEEGKQIVKNDPNLDEHSQKVIEEVSSRVPELIEVMFHSFTPDIHTNIRLTLLHCGYELLSSCILYYPSSFLVLLDHLVSELNADHCVIRETSQLLLESLPAFVEDHESLKMEVYHHICQQLSHLVTNIKHSTDFTNVKHVRMLVNYCMLFKNDLPVIIGMNGNVVEEMHSIYTDLKECLKIQRITTVGMELVTTNSVFYTIHYCYCNEEVTQLLFQLIRILGESMSLVEEDVVLWFLDDYGKESEMVASLISVEYFSYHKTLTPSLRELIQVLFDSLLFTSSQRTLTSPNVSALMILVVTSLLIQTNSVDEFKPNLLSCVVYFRSLLNKHGVVLSCIDKICSYYHYHSLHDIIQLNYDYLFDSLLMKIRFVLSLQDYPLLKQYIGVLTSIWNELGSENMADEKLISFAQDSINVGVELFHSQQNTAIDLFLPVTSFLVSLYPDQSESLQTSPSSVESFVSLYFDHLSESRIKMLQSSYYSQNEKPTIEEDSGPTKNESEVMNLLRLVVKSVKFAINYSSDIHVIQAATSIFITLTKLPKGDDQFELLNTARPFFHTLINQPNQLYYSSVIAIYLRLIELDQQSTISYLQDDCWPSIKHALEGCIRAQQDDFEIIQNREYAIQLENRLIGLLCDIYKNSFVFESIAYQICEIVDLKTTTSLSESYVELLKLVITYNNDAIEQYLNDCGDNASDSMNGKLKCIRFKSTAPIHKRYSNSRFLQSVMACKLLIK